MKNLFNHFGRGISAAFAKKSWLFDIVIAFFIAVISCLFASTSLSPLYPANNYDFINVDSNFFLYSASLLLKGKTPYLQVYDHKGLYHLAVDCLGLMMGGRYGVWALEIVFTFVAVLFLLRSVRLISGDSLKSYVAAAAFFLFFRISIGSGNIEGEWVLPFASLYFYFYVKAIEEKKDLYFLFGSFFMGLEVGLSLNSRPLDALWGGSGAICYLVYWIKHKKGQQLLWNVLLALGGCALPFAIIIPLALKGNYLSAMLEAIWRQNFSYIQRGDMPLTTWLTRLLIVGFLAVGMLNYFLEKKNHREKNDLNEFFLSTTVITCVLYLPLMRYYSYIFSGITFYSLAMGYAVYSFEEPFKKFSFGTALISLCLLAYTILNCCLVGFYYGSGYEDFSFSQSKEIESQIIKTIPVEDRNAEGKVFALGCDASVYLDGGITVNERFFCNQTWWSVDNQEVIPEVEAYLSSSSRPTWLLVAEDADTQAAFGTVIADYYVTTTVKNAHFEIYRTLL